MSWYNLGEQSQTPPPPPSPRPQAPPSRGEWQPRDVGVSPAFGGVRHGQVRGPAPSPMTASATSRRRGGGGALLLTPLALVTALVALVYLASSFLNWIDGLGVQDSAHDGPLRYLWDNTASSGSPSIGIVVVVVGFLAAAAALVRRLRFLAPVLGVVALAIVALFLVQTQLLVGDARDAGIFDGNLFDLVGIGAYVGLGAGLLLVVIGSVSGARGRA